jgi:uncharacterized protein (UPF0179 family)
MKDPCKLCLVKPACIELCEQKNDYDIKRIGKHNRRMEIIFETVRGFGILVIGLMAFIFVVMIVGLGAR